MKYLNVIRAIWHVSNGDFLTQRANCSCNTVRCPHFLPKMDALLDYIQILLFEPQQSLPVLILQGPHSTGKTLFVKICMRAMEASGNLHWATALGTRRKNTRLMIYEEPLLPGKKAVHSDKCAIIITTNTEYKEHRRGEWVCTIHEPITNDTFDSDGFLETEIPAFVDYLKNRSLLTNRESCNHFNPELITNYHNLIQKGKGSPYPPMDLLFYQEHPHAL